MKLGRWTLEHTAAMGGSLSRCAFDGRDILRPAIGKSDPRQMSAFPMVPFIGRITNGEFEFGGHLIKLPKNMPPEPHAIHGRGWQSAWSVEESPKALTLSHTHDGKSDWPWAYSTKQIFVARENALELTMHLKNKSDRPMPGGLGWHPYFPNHGAHLQSDVISVWVDDDKGIIGHALSDLTEATDLSRARSVEELGLDHCFYTGARGSVLTWPDMPLTVKIEVSPNLGHLTVYTPKNEPYFCVEPVSHAPDAVNMAHPTRMTGLTILEPGEKMMATIALKVAI